MEVWRLLVKRWFPQWNTKVSEVACQSAWALVYQDGFPASHAGASDVPLRGATLSLHLFDTDAFCAKRRAIRRVLLAPGEGLDGGREQRGGGGGERMN